ncbi:MAG TPA: type II toxin-antitoxin system VapC family toxin [Rhizomicrobium sp.]
MKFWDTSALVPLLVNEASTTAMTSLFFSDPSRAVWWTTPVECISALTRRLRSQEIDRAQFDTSLARLAGMQDDWSEAPPTEQIRIEARRLLEAYPLRAADAFQLAAALETARSAPQPLAFVCLDGQLAAAARSEGFRVEP